MVPLTLTVNPSATPVPWGPLMLASLVVDAGSGPVVQTKFDPEGATLALTSESDTVATDSFDIIEKIAAGAGLPEDTSKVCCIETSILSIDFSMTRSWCSLQLSWR
jgi:hypothetical protein